ncbi:MAG: hypothetical protein WBE28_08050 [bacterium]
MSKRLVTITFVLVMGANLVWANHTRMSALMAGDYIDDIIYTDIYPQRLLTYENTLFLDIRSGPGDFGIVATPNPKYGVIACWQNPVSDYGFNFGYAINVFNFDVGISLSPIKDNTRFGLGLGRTFFDQHIDASFLTFDGVTDKWHRFTARYVRRINDYNIVPKYSFDYVFEPFDHGRHKIGVMFQKLILNEGFVFLGAEYDFSRGDIEHDSTHIHAGVELKLTRLFVLRCGVVEHFDENFENAEWQVEPGIGLRIRDFRIDFHFNKDRLFDKEQTFFKSFGLDFNFGRF